MALSGALDQFRMSCQVFYKPLLLVPSLAPTVTQLMAYFDTNIELSKAVELVMKDCDQVKPHQELISTFTETLNGNLTMHQTLIKTLTDLGVDMMIPCLHYNAIINQCNELRTKVGLEANLAGLNAMTADFVKGKEPEKKEEEAIDYGNCRYDGCRAKLVEGYYLSLGSYGYCDRVCFTNAMTKEEEKPK